LTLEAWHVLLTWRALDALLSLLVRSSNSEEDVAAHLPVLAHLFVAALQGLETVSNGNNALLPMIRCVRAVMPILVCEHNGQEAVAAIVATAEANGSGDQLDAATLDAVIAWIARVMVSVFNTQLKRRSGLTAAIISTCLHPCLFEKARATEGDGGGGGVSTSSVSSPVRARALHEEGGALHCVVQQFVTMGLKASRLLVLLSTHLGALLAAFPSLGPAYADVIVDLCMKGFDDDMQTSLSPLVRAHRRLLL